MIEIDPSTGSPILPVTKVEEPVSLPKTAEQVKAESVLPIPTKLNQDVNKGQAESKEREIDPTLHNLIEESKKKNAELTAKLAEERLTIKIPQDHATKLNNIREVLRNSGADSMQQAKAYDLIREILGW